MSNNQNKAPAGAPQQQPRYTQGSDGGFHVTTPPAFVSQQAQNQPPNQGGSIRGMAPTGPPTQASTPPQTEQMKQMQQQPGQIQMAYVSQTVRGQGYHYRTPPPNPGGPRMTHRQVPANQMYQAMPMYSTTIPQTMTYHPVQMNYPNSTPRAPPFYPTQYPMLPGQFIHGSFPAQQPQTPQTYYPPQFSQAMTMPGQRPPGPAIPTAPQGATQPQQTVMPPPLGQQPQIRKKRDKAIPIINPNTGKNINDEDESLPTSGDNSARETPQPNNNMQVVAEFAARVAIVASEDKMNEVPEPVEPVIFQPNEQPTTDPNEHLRKTESIVQNSILQVSTKEFVPETKHVPKEEITPIDSNRVEVPPPASSPVKIKAPPNKPMQQSLPPQQMQPPMQQQIPPVQIQQPIQIQQVQPPMLPIQSQNQPPQQFIPKEAEASVYVNQEQVHEPQLDKINNKVNKVVKMEQSKNIEHNVKETTPVDDPDKGKRAQQKIKESAPVPTAAAAATAAATAAAVAAAAAAAKQNTAVPGSQPPKPTSKSNKMRELNMKGNMKEGTDMDAFSTGESGAVIENCNQQQQPPMQNVQQKVQQVQSETISQTVIDSAIPVTNNTTTTSQKPTEIKPQMMKNKVDVTSIVKEVPKTIKPFTANQQVVTNAPNPIESQDETDRAVTEKLVQVKNEANIKANAAADTNDNQIIDKNTIKYKEGQWSPQNVTGKKIYDRDFLLCLQNNPKSKKKPDNLPDLDVILKDSNRNRMSDQKQFPFNRQPEVLMPPFTKSMSQRGPPPKRNSQQGRTSSKSGKPNAIHVTISLKEDVKLRETENAWRPARLVHSATMTEDDQKTAALYKKVRGVLNKLTPEKFEKLLNQVQELTIDNEERLQGVIDLVFEKAVDEPNYSVAYANMCKELALMQVPVDRKCNKNDAVEHVNFRKLIITRCQLEFEKNSIDEHARIIKVKEIDECNDPEKKKEMQLLLEESDRRIRMKSVGNIRFIGELFKQQMLTVNIMLKCINILLENKDEDSLECLCKLLTTIGKDLEHAKKQNLSQYFQIMQDIVDKKHGKISSRVRFMLQDVIDLRSSKWVPRRQDLNPRTMEQIQKEADTEQLNIQVMNTPRKDDRIGGGNAGSERKNRNRNNANEDGWSMAAPRGRTVYQVESSKLMNKPPPMDEITLGSKNQFGQWIKGSNIKAQTHAPVTNTANMYAALENINSEEKTRSNYESRLKDSYVSKGPSMERSGYNKNYEDGQGSRSGSQHRNSQQRPTPSPSMSMKREEQQQQQAPVEQQPPIPQLTEHQLELKMKTILEEYLNECADLKECMTEVKLTIDPSKMQLFVSRGYNEVLDCSTTARLKMGKLFANLIKNNQLTIEDYTSSLRELLMLADDLVIDIPMLWTYLAEMIVPLLSEGAFTMDRLKTCMDVLISQGHSHKLLAQLLRQLIADKGPGYVNEIWQSSGVSFTDFMPSDLVNSFIKDNQFDFMVGGAGIPVMAGSISWDNVYKKLLEFIKSQTNFDAIIDWITANIGEHKNENQFIRTLVTAICENAMYEANGTKKIDMDKFMNQRLLLQRYIDNNENYELQCLYAVQALVHKLEHPPGILLSIFEKLWEDGYVSNESLFAWEASKDPAEQEGKAIALVALQRLFTELNEPEEDDSSED